MGLTIEELWTEILSREPERVVRAWRSLSPEDQAAVHEHLKRMAHEEGWTEPQCVSARAALAALKGLGEIDK